MNCSKFKERLNLEFHSEDSGLPSELDDHIRACDSCRAYYSQLARTREILNRQSFEVRPGELDDITFEKIAGAKPVSIPSESVFDKIKAVVGRRVWVPAVAAAAVVILVFAPRMFKGSNGIYYSNQQYGSLETTDDYSSIQSSEDLAYVVESLMDDDSEVDLVADELMMDTDYEDLIDYLSDDELDALYERIETMNGSS